MMAAERDPHDIVPDGFYDEFDSVRQAARDAPVATDSDDRTRCPACGSTNLRYRPGPTVAEKSRHAEEELYKCRNCGAAFDEPEGEE